MIELLIFLLGVLAFFVALDISIQTRINNWNKEELGKLSERIEALEREVEIANRSPFRRHSHRVTTITAVTTAPRN